MAKKTPAAAATAQATAGSLVTPNKQASKPIAKPGAATTTKVALNAKVAAQPAAKAARPAARAVSGTSKAASAAKATSPKAVAKAAVAKTIMPKTAAPKATAPAKATAAPKTVAAAKPRRPAPLTLVKNDPWLAPFEDVLRARQARLQARLAEIEQYHGSLLNYATAHQQLGLNHDAARGGWVYREWAPAADYLALVGDFNGWDRGANPLQKLDFGVWELFLPDAEYDQRLTHGSRFKVYVAANGQGKDRLPATLRRAVQDDETKDFAGQIWRPETPFAWTDKSSGLPPPWPSRSFTRHTWAWLPRKAAWAPTVNSPKTSCPASRLAATTPCS